MKKVNVGILGATGIVGQAFLWMLAEHEMFNISFISASKHRSGGKYSREVRWLMPYSMPSTITEMELKNYSVENLKDTGCEIIFSALPSDVAGPVEKELAENGFFVFSNAGANRRREDVPILIPEANPDSLELIKIQGYPEKGFIICNSNCSTTGLATALAPLKRFGLKEITVSTYQSVSGAGFPGVSSMEIYDNVVPYIQGEEEKMAFETGKILEIDCPVYSTCVRVPTLFGHLETVWVEFEKEVSTNEVINAWSSFTMKTDSLPSQPENPVVYCDRPDAPQPKMSFHGTPPGMTVYTGRVKKTGNKIGFSLLVNNIIKGAAGGSIQNAEHFLKYRRNNK